MSANLLDGIVPTLQQTSRDGSVYVTSPRTSSTGHDDYIVYDLSMEALKQNQTFHVGLSVKVASASNATIYATIGYVDSAGNWNWRMGLVPVGTSWARAECVLTIPSGMTPKRLYIAKWGQCPEVRIAGVVLSYGSPVTLASSAHTPYATQDHVAAEYSTKASQKILSDSITSEVNARAKTDDAVSELSSKMEQTVNGINVSLDKLTATEKQIHSWFDFGSDASGNPKLAMGSSSSPIIGEYSNTGTTYKDRSGATLLALDAANSTTGADHVVSNDVAIGKWQWVPTNNGTHLTLMWRG